MSVNNEQKATFADERNKESIRKFYEDWQSTDILIEGMLHLCSACPPERMGEDENAEAVQDILHEQHYRITDLQSENTALKLEVEKMKDLLEECEMQIKYLHDKFKPTGTGNAVLFRIQQVLNKN